MERYPAVFFFRGSIWPWHLKNHQAFPRLFTRWMENPHMETRITNYFLQQKTRKIIDFQKHVPETVRKNVYEYLIIILLRSQDSNISAWWSLINITWNHHPLKSNILPKQKFCFASNMPHESTRTHNWPFLGSDVVTVFLVESKNRPQNAKTDLHFRILHWWFRNPAPVDVSRYPNHPRWLFGTSEPSAVAPCFSPMIPGIPNSIRPAEVADIVPPKAFMGPPFLGYGSRIPVRSTANIVPGSFSTPYIEDKLIPPLRGNPYNGYITPYWISLMSLSLGKQWELIDPTFFGFEALKPLEVPPEIGSKNGDSPYIWLVVSTHLKNISQIGAFPQVGVNIKNIWNHHL